MRTCLYMCSSMQTHVPSHVGRNIPTHRRIVMCYISICIHQKLRSPRALEIFHLHSLDLLHLLLPLAPLLSLLPFPAKDPCFAKVCEPLRPAHCQACERVFVRAKGIRVCVCVNACACACAYAYACACVTRVNSKRKRRRTGLQDSAPVHIKTRTAASCSSSPGMST